MAPAPALRGRDRARTRRWDTVVLGGALPGLVCAAVLAQRGARVLVLEEEAAARGFPGLREPFFAPGAERDGVLGACLRQLGIPLIDQRRVQLDPVALQVVLPDARLDVGDPGLTASEWVAWGLAKPQLARALAHALAEAGEAERRALLAAPFVRTHRRLSLGALRGLPARRPLAPAAPEAAPPGVRGLPAALDEAPPSLAAVLAAQARALHRLGASGPSREAQARLLGAPFEGAASIRGVPWLREILRQRVLALYGEFRTLSGPFALVAASGQPGVAPANSEEIWSGRLLVLNAPLAALAAVAAPEGLHGILRAPVPARRRVALHVRVPRRAVPEGMAPRVLHLRDPAAPPEGANLVALRLFPGPGDADAVDLVASLVAPAEGADEAALERALAESLDALMPFAAAALERVRAAAPPRWDREDWLPDPPAGAGWPAELEIRAGAREPVYHLDRAAAASLGVEGDLLLGWRGAEAILADLS